MSNALALRISLGFAIFLSACGEIKTDNFAAGDAGIDAAPSDAPGTLGCASPCGANAACVNVGGSDMCQCNPGFAKDGVRCANIDECATGVHMCDPKTRCTDQSPLYACSPCPPGTLDTDPGVGTKCQADMPDSMQVVAPGATALEACGGTGDGDLDGDGVDGQLLAALLVNGEVGMDAAGYGRNPARPLKSIGYAIAVAHADIDRNQIYVASTNAQDAEIVYAENLKLPRGIHLFGGYSHNFATRNPAHRTLVKPASGVPLVVDYLQATDEGSYIVEGFVFDAPAPAPNSGESSIAAIAQDQAPPAAPSADAGVADAAVADAGAPRAEAKVAFLNNTLLATAGANGKDGAKGKDGRAGCPGRLGTPSNTARTQGFQTTNNCYAERPGASGGGGGAYVGQDGEDSGAAKGGLGGKKDSAGSSVCLCSATVGDDGRPGEPGEAAAPADRPAPQQTLGTIALVGGVFRWMPAKGTVGAFGTAGRGGAGGGGSFGACNGVPLGGCQGVNGASGGSGGGGGEYGEGGEGGQGAGGSVGLLLVHMRAQLACLNIATNQGGIGGKGGLGGVAGPGGVGGFGGPPMFIGGSRTGIGGQGGHGSPGRPGFPGQGGRGGISVGVLMLQTMPKGLAEGAASDTHNISVGQAGAGGPEIASSEPGYAGDPGVAARTLTIP